MTPPRRAARLSFLAAAAGLGSFLFRRLATERTPDPATQEDVGELLRPLRMEVVSPGAFEQFLLALRVHHYRPQPLGEAVYEDVFYDTAEHALLGQGYSYRFRRKLQGAGVDRYGVRLTGGLGGSAGPSERMDLYTELPSPLGEAVMAGDWSLPVLGGRGLDAPDRLGQLLITLGVPARELLPAIRSELRRERFDVTDKGQSWFELDDETWVFRPFSGPDDGASYRVEDIVVDTRLRADDPELLRRVRTMRQLARMVYGVRPVDRTPVERAAKGLHDDRTSLQEPRLRGVGERRRSRESPRGSRAGLRSPLRKNPAPSRRGAAGRRLVVPGSRPSASRAQLPETVSPAGP